MKLIAIRAFLLAKRLALGGAKQAGPRKAQPPGPSRQNIHGSNPARRASSAIAIGKLRRIIRRECGSSEELAERIRKAGPSARTKVLGRDDYLKSCWQNSRWPLAASESFQSPAKFPASTNPRCRSTSGTRRDGDANAWRSLPSRACSR